MKKRLLKYHCPCCGGQFRKFSAYGLSPRPRRKNARCPNCNCLERHRLIYLFLKYKTDFFNKNLRVLHIAPTRVFIKLFNSLENIEYFHGRIDSSNTQNLIDITNLKFNDRMFDTIICSHVLEYIKEEEKALRELFRVLIDDGLLLLLSHIDFSLEKTFEDPNVKTEEEREQKYGNKEHYRTYSRHYSKRIEKVGFSVKEINYTKELGVDKSKKYCLNEEDIIYLCSKSFSE